MLTVVIARYRENIEWVNQLACNVVIVDKAQTGNTGREAASWLWFITQHYQALEGDYVFAQGNPFEHCPDFVQRLGRGEPYGPRIECDWNGAPDHPGLRLLEAAQFLGLDRWPERIEFTVGAQFQRSADELRKLARASYEKWHRLANEHPQGPWILERLWDYLIL